jgi:hypothetical protein
MSTKQPSRNPNVERLAVILARHQPCYAGQFAEWFCSGCAWTGNSEEAIHHQAEEAAKAGVLAVCAATVPDEHYQRGTGIKWRTTLRAYLKRLARGQR